MSRKRGTYYVCEQCAVRHCVHRDTAYIGCPRCQKPMRGAQAFVIRRAGEAHRLAGRTVADGTILEGLFAGGWHRCVVRMVPWSCGTRVSPRVTEIKTGADFTYWPLRWPSLEAQS